MMGDRHEEDGVVTRQGGLGGDATYFGLSILVVILSSSPS